jgi:hypothetical protein
VASTGGEDRLPSWELWLIVGGAVLTATIGVLKALDRAGGVVFTALAVAGALAALGLALATKALKTQPRPRVVRVLAVAAGAFVVLVAIGLLTFQPPEGGPHVNARYLATLVENGPFDQALPEQLVYDGLERANIGDASASQRLTAVRVLIVAGPTAHFPYEVFADVEIYPSVALAHSRWAAQRDGLVAHFSNGTEGSTDGSTCVSETAAWTCVGTRGLAYAEVTLTPNPNATRPLVVDTLSALLSYTDEKAVLARS